MFEHTGEYGFYVKSDDTFQAFVDNVAFGMGNKVFKAEKKTEEGSVYPFIAKASTSDKDREGEVMIQKGLCFDPFKEHGVFNFNHIGHAMTGMPSGKKAWFEEDGWMCQGEIVSGLPLVKGYDTDMMVTQHNQLKKSGFPRGLCVSIEGKVKSRSKCGRYVLKADIFAIAHTFRPQNPNCTLTMLAKSLNGKAEILERDAFYIEAAKKALSTCDVQSVTKEDLEGADEHPLAHFKRKMKKHLVAKGYSAEAVERHVNAYMIEKFGRK